MKTNILETYTKRLARERAKWIDDTISSALPEWKKKILIKAKSKLVARLLGINIEIENWTIIGNLGTETRIKLNNKIIGKRKFS